MAITVGGGASGPVDYTGAGAGSKRKVVAPLPTPPLRPASMTALGGVTATPPMNPTAGPVGQYYSNPASGEISSFTPHPEQTTNLYQTAPGGTTTVSGKGSVSAPAFENQQQTQLDAQFREKEQQTEIAAHEKEQQAAAAAQQGNMQLAAKLQAEADQRRAGLQIEAEKRRLSYIPTIMGSVDGAGGGDGNIAADEGAARAAAFARAKEQAGQTALASMKALHDVMAETGKMGSSVEANAEGSIIGGGAHDINDFTRSQLMEDLNRAAEIGNRNYAGALTRRGQNISMLPSLAGLISSTGGAY